MSWRKVGAVVIMGMTLLGSCLSVSAEEVEPAGYHVYDIQEDQVSDSWYGIARGTYLQAAVTKIKKEVLQNMRLVQEQRLLIAQVIVCMYGFIWIKAIMGQMVGGR